MSMPDSKGPVAIIISAPGGVGTSATCGPERAQLGWPR